VFVSESTSLDPAVTDPAAGAPVYVFDLAGGVMLRLSAYSVLLCFLAAGVFSVLTKSAGSSLQPTDWVRPVLYVLVCFGTVVAHELVHGVFFRIFGGRPRYGAGTKYFLPYFYATSPGDAFSVRQMIIIGLAPLLTLSTLSLLGALVAPALVGYFAVVFIGNTAGAVGDLWMTSRLIAFLKVKDATVVDLVDGMAVHSQEAEAGMIAERLSARDGRPAGFAVHWLGATLVVLAAEAVAMPIVPFFTDSLLIGPAQLPLMAFEESSERMAWTLNLTSPLVAGFIFAFVARLFARGTSSGAEPRTVE